MKFFIDAQLPRKMVAWFKDAKFDAIHTLDLPTRNETADDQIIAFADAERRIVVTKDSDFVNSHLIHSRPCKLLLVSTGNISNSELQQLIIPLFPKIVREFEVNNFVELGRDGINVRG